MLLRCRVCSLCSTGPTRLAIVISSPSSTHATPSAITSRLWNGAQGSRSIRAGTRLLTTPEGVSLIVLLPGGRRPRRGRRRPTTATCPRCQGLGLVALPCRRTARIGGGVRGRFPPGRSSDTVRRDHQDRAAEAPRARRLRAATLVAGSGRAGLLLFRAWGLQHWPAEALRRRLRRRLGAARRRDEQRGEDKERAPQLHLRPRAAPASARRAGARPRARRSARCAEGARGPRAPPCAS